MKKSIYKCLKIVSYLSVLVGIFMIAFGIIYPDNIFRTIKIPIYTLRKHKYSISAIIEVNKIIGIIGIVSSIISKNIKISILNVMIFFSFYLIMSLGYLYNYISVIIGN